MRIPAEKLRELLAAKLCGIAKDCGAKVLI
jgi:hypothetical protein